MTSQVDQQATKRKKHVDKYFRRTPPKRDLNMAYTRMAGGGALAFLGLMMFASSSFLGFLLLALGGWQGVKGLMAKNAYDKAYEKAEPKPSDAEMNRYLARDLFTLEERALLELNLRPDDLDLPEGGTNSWERNLRASVPGLAAKASERRPIVVYGPSSASGFTIGDDGIWRFRRYEVMVICPTLHHLAIYRGELNMATGGLLGEQTWEYQYNHVVSVSTITEPAPENFRLERTDLDEEEKEKERNKARRERDEDEVRFAKTFLRQFSVSVSSGQRTAVTVGIFDQDDPEKQAQLGDTGINKTIDSIRRVLRDKNGGAFAGN